MFAPGCELYFIPFTGEKYAYIPCTSTNLTLFLRSLGAVFGTGLTPVGNTRGIQGASDDVVSRTGQVLDTAAADQDNAVLLKVVAFAGDVACHLDPVGKTYSGDLSQ